VHAGLLLLAFSSGATDAFAFLSLGGIFTGMMTGNLILIGMFTRPEFIHTLIGAATAITFFASGAFIGFRLSKRIEPGSITTRLLVPSTAVQVVATALWISVPQPPGHTEQYIIVALLAVALSLQTVAAKKASDVTGITTTYVTGTLTTTMQELAESRGRGNLLRLLTVFSLPLGAVCATALVAAAWWAAPLLPLLGSVGATIFLHRSAR
jgi:uncharacterized membrane protein YoaK (UPF0700 family)